MTLPSTHTVLEHAGIVVAALSGVLAARGKRVDLFGVLVLALVTAYGGGTVRDLLAGDLPPVWLRTPDYLMSGTLTAIAAFYIVRIRELPVSVLLVADAFSLALFTMLGARKGVVLDFPMGVSVLFGVVTGVAGGIIRDVLLGEVPLVFRPEIHLYATAALCGASVFVAVEHFGMATPASMFVGFAVVLGLRLAAIRWRISLPALESK
jgi:uncharacterized membrane protein YeiH